MNVWTPTRPTPAWTHRPPLSTAALEAYLRGQIQRMGLSAAPYGPGAFAADQVAPADPDAVLWPQTGAQPLPLASSRTNPLRLRVTVDPTLPPDRIELRPTPTRTEQIADLIAAHRIDWSTDGTRVGCSCDWWADRPKGQDVEVQHARHLATEIVALDRATVPPAWRDERLRARQEIEDLRAELRECLAASQDDADARSDVATTWRSRHLDQRQTMTETQHRLGESLASIEQLRAQVRELEESRDGIATERQQAELNHLLIARELGLDEGNWSLNGDDSLTSVRELVQERTKLRTYVRELEVDADRCTEHTMAATGERMRLRIAVQALLDNDGTTVRPSVLGPVLDALRG